MQDKKYKKIETRIELKSDFEKCLSFVKNTFKPELCVGLWVVLREMIVGKRATFRYPLEKVEMSPRYRGTHKLMRLLESGDERCIGCGLCQAVCVSKCIGIDSKLGEDGRKKVSHYSINYGRCVYCGLCADACPEIAIVHGKEYEYAAEQRAYYALKEDMLTDKAELKNQEEFLGYGSLPKDSNERIKLTPTDYLEAAKEDNKKEGE